MAEQRMKVCWASMPRPCQSKQNNEREKRKGGEFSQPPPRAYPAIVHPCQRDGDRQPQQNMREVNRVTAQPVQLMRIQRREQISCDAPGGERFKGASEKVAEKDHPSSGEADARRKELGDVGGFSCRIGGRSPQGGLN